MEQIQMQTMEMEHAGAISRALSGWQARPVRRALLWGVVSGAVYFLIFSHADAVTEYFTRGGVYAAAIIGTALAVSIIHSAFANYVLEILDIRPSGKGGH